MMRPVNLSFNIAVVALASRVCPVGYDTTAGRYAPSSLNELNDHIQRTGRIMVSEAESDETIFGDKETNWAFRAWHDWTHWNIQAPFTLAGEVAVATEQYRHLVGLYGEKTAAPWKPLLFAEVVGQALAQEISGQFPINQVSFDRHLLAICGARQAYASIANAAI